MDSKNIFEGASVQTLSAAVDLEKKEIDHAEYVANGPPTINKVLDQTDLTPKE